MRHLLLVMAFIVLTGCGKSGGDNLAAVSGSVTFDGQPVSEGSITFKPAEGTVGPTSGETIKAGKYTITQARGVAIGKNKVEIVANRKTGKKVPNAAVPGTDRDEVEQYIPAKYNTTTELTKDVKAGTNEINFELTK